MPDPQPLVQTTPNHVTYINYVFSSFISGIADYIRSDLFPRAQDTVISTHTKAVEMVRTRKNLAGENWSPKFPFLVVTPNIDFRPDPLIGRPLHNYPNFNSRAASWYYQPRIYQDDDVYIAPVLNRYVGTIEVTAWCGSIYEVIDLRTRIIQMFGNEGSYIQPRNLDCQIIIPEYLENYVYENKYTGETRTLDWSGSSAYTESKLIRNINQNHWTYTVTLRPYLRLDSIDDNSDPFGGAGSSLTDFRLTILLSWECNIPVHLVLVAYKQPTPSVPITFEISYNYRYITNPLDSTSLIQVADEIFSTAVTDASSGTVDQTFLEYLNTENYTITASDVSSFANQINVEITPSETITDSRFLKIHGKYGFFKEPIHYDVTSEGKIKLYGHNMSLLEEGDILTFIYYSE